MTVDQPSPDDDTKMAPTEVKGDHAELIGDPERAIDALEALTDKVNPKLLALLCEPNAVLTLAGARGQTESFIDFPTAEDDKALEIANDVLRDQGIRLSSEWTTSAATKTPAMMINVESLKGYVDVSRSTKIPGITPFDATSGWDGLSDWINECREGLATAQEQGLIDPGLESIQLLAGVARGYPDRAILGYIEALAAGTEDSGTDLTDISHATEYPGPSPNYRYAVVDHTDYDILTHQQRWGKILGDFYASDWHQTMKDTAQFKDGLAELQRDSERADGVIE